MRMINRNKRSVCLCERAFTLARVCVGGGGLRIVCNVAYSNVWQWTVHVMPEQVTCFGISKLLVLLLSFFAYSNSIPSSSFVLRAPFYDTLPRPTSIPLTWELFIFGYLSSDDNPLFRYLDVAAYISLYWVILSKQHRLHITEFSRTKLNYSYLRKDFVGFVALMLLICNR